CHPMNFARPVSVPRAAASGAALALLLQSIFPSPAAAQAPTTNATSTQAPATNTSAATAAANTTATAGGTPTNASAEPPTSWIDPHRGPGVIRLPREPGSDSFYFNYNAFPPDGKKMAYTTPAGISVLNLDTLEARHVVDGPAKTIIVAPKTPNLYYTKPG